MEKISKEKYKIAVVEDEETIVKTLVGELKDADFDVVTAADGKTGLELAAKEKPDLILLDIVMPKMDGMTMLKKLRGLGEYGAHVPVILLTNLNADDKIMHDVVQEEPAYYLVKSTYTLADVVVKVKDCLKIAHAVNEGSSNA